MLLAGSDAARAALLEERLGKIGGAVLRRSPAGSLLPDAVASGAPDVIVVDMVGGDRDLLEALRRVAADNPRPVAMFADRYDRGLMEEAIAAGVSSYTVAAAGFPDVAPIVSAAVALFDKYQRVASDLQEARKSLIDRATIDRAKALLMKQRHIGEPQAYRWLRRKAMNENKRIAAVAAELLGAPPPETSSR